MRAEISPLANARSDPTVVWWLYVLACDGGVLYVGISPDPVKRFLDHQARKSRFSQMRRPRELLASLPIGPHLLAAREERRLKRQPVANKLEWVAIARQAPSWLRLVKKHGTAIFMASCLPDSAPSPHAQEISYCAFTLIRNSMDLAVASSQQHWYRESIPNGTRCCHALAPMTG